MSVLTVSPAKASERMKNLVDLEVYVKGLIYGPAGSGKTFLTCTAPNPVLVLSDYQVAKPTLKALKRERGIDPDLFVVDSTKDFENAYVYISAHTKDYDTCVVDSASDLNDRIITEIIADARLKRAAHDPDQLETQDWLKVGNRLQYWVRLFRDLPMHTLFTALDMPDKSGMMTVPLIQPNKTQAKFPAFFNLVGYLSCEQRPNKQSLRRLYVDSTNIYVAKNPGGALQPTIENPDMGILIPQIVNYLEGRDTAKTA